MSKADYLSLLSTRSVYWLLEDAARARLIGALAGVLDDQVTLAVDTVLYLARRTAAAGTEAVR